MGRELADGPDRPLLRPFGQATKRSVRAHPLWPWGPGAPSCACALTVRHRQYRLMNMVGGVYQDDFGRRWEHKLRGALRSTRS